jgi:hypothetical protein
MPCMYTMEQVAQKDSQLTAITECLDVIAQRIEGWQKVKKFDIQTLDALLRKKEMFDSQELRKMLESFYIRVGLVLCERKDSTFADPSPEVEKTEACKLWKKIGEMIDFLKDTKGPVFFQSMPANQALNILGKKKRCKRCCMCLKNTWWFGQVLMVSTALSAAIIWLLEPLTESNVYN